MEQPAQIPTTFIFQNYTIRIVQKKNGSIWFVNSDICQVLGIANSREALDYLYPEEKNVVEGQEINDPGELLLSTVGAVSLETVKQYIVDRKGK